MVYINAGPYAGSYSVNSVDGTGILVINTVYIANATGFITFNSIRPYYQVRTQITYQDAISGQQNTIISTNRPNNSGLVVADISNFLQSLLRAKDDSDFTQLNYRDKNLKCQLPGCVCGILGWQTCRRRNFNLCKHRSIRIT